MKLGIDFLPPCLNSKDVDEFFVSLEKGGLEPSARRNSASAFLMQCRSRQSRPASKCAWAAIGLIVRDSRQRGESLLGMLLGDGELGLQQQVEAGARPESFKSVQRGLGGVPATGQESSLGL